MIALSYVIVTGGLCRSRSWAQVKGRAGQKRRRLTRPCGSAQNGARRGAEEAERLRERECTRRIPCSILPGREGMRSYEEKERKQREQVGTRRKGAGVGDERR